MRWLGRLGRTSRNIKETKPSLFLVHDDGVYLMSASTVDNSAEDGQRQRVAYAQGCNPKTDEDHYENARDLVGGDDFAENVPVNPAWGEVLDKCKELTIKLTATQLAITLK